MSSNRWQQVKARFFCMPNQNKSEDNFNGTDEATDEERERVENKITTLKEKLSATKKYLQQFNEPYVFFVRDETFVDTIEDAYSNIKNKKEFDACERFIDSMLATATAYHALLERRNAIAAIMKKLKSSPDDQESKTQLTTQRAALKVQHEECLNHSTKLVDSTLQLPGKIAKRNMLIGGGLILAGAVVFGASVAMLVFAPLFMPLAAFGVIAGLCAVLMIGGSILAIKSRQQGFSKEAYDECRSAEKQAESMVKSVLR